ncbi:MAG: hypothetical protein AAAC47_24965, partial [Pararhizobium sp.]
PEDMTPRRKAVAEAIDRRRVGGLAGPYLPLLYSPDVADHVQSLAEYLRFGLRLPDRLRALALLVTAGRHRSADVQLFCELKDVRDSGLATEKIALLAGGRRPHDMDVDEGIIYDFVAQLSATGRVTENTFNTVLGRFDREICIELIVICGFTAFMTTLLNITESRFSAS